MGILKGIRIFIICSLFAVLLTEQAAQAEEATRVALVSTCAQLNTQKALALAEAELGQGDGLELVERTRIDLILGEQRACELFDGRRVVVLGELLNAEIFAVVENYAPEHKAAALVVFDSSRGIRLWDTVLPSGGVEQVKEAIVSGVRNAIQKYRISYRLITVCLLAVRNTDLPLEQDSACQSVGLLIERQLVDSDLIAVLERNRLEHINRERSLPTTASLDDLFPALVTMDVEISKATEQGKVKGEVFFTDSDGQKLGAVSHEVNLGDWAGLAEALVEKMAGYLQVSPAPKPGDRKQEAQRFYQESVYLDGHDDLLGALHSIESAHALDPTNTVITDILVKRLVAMATDLMPENIAGGNAHSVRSRVKRSLRMADRGVKIATDLRKSLLPDNPSGEVPLIDGGFYMLFERELALTRYMIRTGLPRTDEMDPEERRMVAELKAQLRHLLVNLIASQVRQSGNLHHVDELYNFARIINNLQRDLEPLCPDSQAWMDDMLKVFSLYSNMAEKIGPRWEWQVLNNRILLQLICQMSNRALSEQQQALPFIARMEEHICPLHQMYGRMGRLLIERGLKGYSQREVDARYEVIQSFIREQIVHPAREDKNLHRLLAYLAAGDAIDLFLAPPKRQQAYQDLFDFMLSRNEIEMMTAHRVVRTKNATFMPHTRYGKFVGRAIEHYTVSSNDWPRLLDNCNQAIEIAGSPDSNKIGGQFFSWTVGSPEADLLLDRRKLYQCLPELAPKPDLPWSEARKLYDSSGSAWPRMERSLMSDGNIFVLETTGSSGSLTLVKISLSAGKPSVISRTRSYPLVGEPCVFDGKLYMATRANGVLVFPLNGGPVSLIDQSLGFIDEGIESMACVGGKLYAGIKDRSLIMAYDLNTLQSEVLVSGNRKDALTPLDNQVEPFGVPFMMSDPERNRVLFTTSLNDGEKGGLWEIDVETDQVNHLLPLHCRLQNIYEYKQDRLLFYAACVGGGMYESVWSPGSVVEFDLKTNIATALASFDHRITGPTVAFADPIMRIGFQYREVLLMWGDQLWLRLSKDELGILNQTQEIPTAIPASREYCGDCGIWSKLWLLPDGDIIAANPCGVWLLGMPEVDPKREVKRGRPPLSAIPVSGETSLEIESFILNNAMVEPMEGAGGGTIVRLENMGHARQTVSLPAGYYELIVYAKGSPNESKGIRLQLNEIYRDEGWNVDVVNEKLNVLGPWEALNSRGPLVVHMEKAGELRLMFTTWNPDVCLDRILILPIENVLAEKYIRAVEVIK